MGRNWLWRGGRDSWCWVLQGDLGRWWSREGWGRRRGLVILTASSGEGATEVTLPSPDDV